MSNSREFWSLLIFCQKQFDLGQKLKQFISIERMKSIGNVGKTIGGALHPLQSVRSTCTNVVLHSSHVVINDDAITSIANIMIKDQQQKLKNVEWDAFGWHYNADSSIQGPLTCQYIFVMDSLNFCFWPTEGLEYDTLAMSLKTVLESDTNAFSSENLVNMDENKLQSWFPTFKLPLLSERVARLRELGEALAYFDGLAANMVSKADGSAVKLVQLILRYCPGFRDTSIYKGQLVHFYKRAQILVGDIWAAYGRPTAADHRYSFQDMDQLTMFADYRVPQILRKFDILQYSEALSAKIDRKEEIPSGSEEELEIRACTVIAVERLQQAFKTLGQSILVLELDWLLWQQGEQIKDHIPPHHRTLTIYY